LVAQVSFLDFGYYFVWQKPVAEITIGTSKVTKTQATNYSRCVLYSDYLTRANDTLFLDRLRLTNYSNEGISFKVTSIPLYLLSLSTPSSLFLRVEIRLIVLVK